MKYAAIIVVFAVLVMLWLVWATPVVAQEDMKHPTTGEAGAWIPRWLQKEHLVTDAKLKTCDKVTTTQKKELQAKDREAKNLDLALYQEKEASEVIVKALADTSLVLEEEIEHNNTLNTWLWGTSSTALIATTVLVLVVAL